MRLPRLMPDRCEYRRCLRRGIILVMLLAGCTPADPRAPEAIRVTPGIRQPQVLLLSEVFAAEDRRRLLASDFFLQNLTQAPQSVSLAGKSCTCYAVLLDDEPLEVGSTFALAPGTARRLRFDVTAPPLAGEQTWRVQLRIRREDGDSIELPVALAARIIADARLEPTVVSVDKDSGTAAGMRPLSFRIVRTWRGTRDDDVAPQLRGLEDWQTWTSIEADELHELQPGLWQKSWTCAVAIPADFPLADGLHPFEATFGSPPSRSSTAEGRLVVKSRQGVVAPRVVHLGRTRVGEARRRRIILAADDGRAFRLRDGNVQSADAPASPSAPPDDLRLEFEQDRSDLRHVVDVEWRPSAAGAAVRTITFMTDHPRRPQIRIAVRGVAMDSAGLAASTAPDR